ncbi:MAG: hypothetical protein ABH883_01050 [Candidatus Omnitrophota bacterium]
MKKIFLYHDRKAWLRKTGAHGERLSIDLDNFTFTVNAVNGPDAVEISLRGAADKERLEKEYTGLIAGLGGKNNTLYWWAGALSEKNPFTSLLFTRIYKLACFRAALEKKTGALEVVLFSEDKVLIRQIAANGAEQYRAVSAPDFYPCFFIKRLLTFLKGSLRVLKRSVTEYSNLSYARNNLRDKLSGVRHGKKLTVLCAAVDHRNYSSGKYRDPYFNRLPDFLSSRGENVMFLGRVHGNYRKSVDDIRRDPRNLIVPVNAFLRKTDILRCLAAAFFRRPSARKGVILDGMKIDALIEAELSADISSCDFFIAMTQYYACLRLGENADIKRFIYTFENYSWEKAGIMGLRVSSPGTLITGFQHAFISKNSFNYFPGGGEEKAMPFPDKIVTMGGRTAEIMRRFGNYPEGVISPGCALRQEYLFSLPVLERARRGAIFVPLTITIADTVKVFRFLYNGGLGKGPDKVYFRFHPATPKDKVLSSLGFKLPENFIVSDNPPMIEEIKRCSVVLYTWTTVCLEALRMGRPAVYIDVNYPLEVDPLFECGHLTARCARPEDLSGVIDRLRGMDEEMFRKEAVSAGKYLDEYFFPVNENTMGAFL